MNRQMILIQLLLIVIFRKYGPRLSYEIRLAFSSMQLHNHVVPSMQCDYF